MKEEATEGEVGLVAKGLERTSGLSVREPGLWGKHRTEATEEEGMEGCRGRVRLRPNRDVECWSVGVFDRSSYSFSSSSFVLVCRSSGVVRMMGGSLVSCEKQTTRQRRRARARGRSGGGRSVAKGLSGHRGSQCENQVSGESIAERGIGIGGER